MFKRLIVLLTTLFLAIPVNADQLQVRDNAPDRYVVKKGDTLWDLSAIYLEKPWLWPKLWRQNPQIKNPHLIYPGDVLSLTYDAQGRPQLSVNSKVIKLSPQIRKKPKNQRAIPPLPLRLIRPYISYEQSLAGEYLDSLPYVMGSTQNAKTWTSSQRLYISQPLDAQTRYAIYRKGQAYKDPTSGEILGYETALVATAKVIREGDTQGNPAAVEVITAINEIRAGDKVLPVNEGQMLPVFFKITQGAAALDATIIASPSNFSEFSKYDIVVINSGYDQQTQVGNMLDIYHRSPTVYNDPDSPEYLEDASRYRKVIGGITGIRTDGSGTVQQMPREKIGEMMVFKVYDRLSYAFVTAASKPIKVGDSTKAAR